MYCEELKELKKIILILLVSISIGCSSAKLHNLSEEKEFVISAAKNEEAWSRTHDYLARTKPEKFSAGFVTDYPIILTGYLDNRDNINFTKTQFTPYFYNLVLTRHKNDNNFVII
jgi:hypothetical protein